MTSTDKQTAAKHAKRMELKQRKLARRLQAGKPARGHARKVRRERQRATTQE